MNYNVLNIVLIVYFIVALFFGFKKGLIATIVHWVGLVVACLLIIRYAPMVTAGIMNKFPIGVFFANILSYLIIFVMVVILSKLVIILLNQIANLLSLTFVNKCFGALIGFLNAVIVLMILITIIELVPYTKSIQEYINKSYIIKETQKIKEVITPNIVSQIDKHKEAKSIKQ
ncbi:MAG: CvpA family protein [Candidatus Cloacimonadales bacterium]|jgi:uncharacterized membrane protein required for colicin V production|nr:CvpA family protein [Candidatus Cloacimonadota bacterium]MDD2650325.1 CvpA family protein [Candidatus Cloacimonadota bacterium]MDD3500965.1 CvpA family protein [Candidatus Cloacimonadota bacterium]MDX9976623.1 CvpA family protein [Candidatus Cloacimonadales bacterium]